MQPGATHVLAFSHTAYTTNLPLADVTGGKAWVVWDYEGRPLEAEHGGPARLLVPHLYFWKSAKFVAGLRPRPRRARVLGAERLSRSRRPLARAALPGRLVDSPPTAGAARAIRGRRRRSSRSNRRRRAPRPSDSHCRVPFAHRAGQHVVVRLTAPDGYTASRSYSIASAPDGSPEIELTVERLEGGEVSTFLHDEVAVGDELEVRGPIGGWFVWDGDSPALLVGGGSGVVPLMAMLRLAPSGPVRPDPAGRLGAHARTICTTPTRSPDPRRPSSTRARRRRRSRVRPRASRATISRSPSHREPARTSAARRVCRRRERRASRRRSSDGADPGRTLRSFGMTTVQALTNRLMKASVVSATSRQPWSMVSEWPRPGILTISVTPLLRFCFL